MKRVKIQTALYFRSLQLAILITLYMGPPKQQQQQQWTNINQVNEALT